MANSGTVANLKLFGGSGFTEGNLSSIPLANHEAMPMPPRRIMIIRHGEKPDPSVAPVPPISVMADKDTGLNNLTPRGWQRAGALVRFFAPHGEHSLRPDAIFATKPTTDFPSLRTQQTVAPLAAVLGLEVGTPAAPDDVQGATAAVLAGSGVTLMAWEHKNIAKLVDALIGNADLAPRWSGHRFDMVLVLDSVADGWTLTQLPQRLLDGDSNKPLRPRAGRVPWRGVARRQRRRLPAL